eukprot:c5227_g1_i1.p1 GENE.c5227_g1_i1~~c5227_g1_i1.p1  ORF type:complete len:204 (-),score=43.61 c5227_g1_i1:72-629(-)
MFDSGRIELILGPMFSGKTTELLRRVRRHRFAQRRCVLVKYAKDDRYSNSMLATHDQCFEAAFSCVNLRAIQSHLIDFEVIGIDEGQFFPDVVEFVDEMALAGKIVIVAALDGTFQRQPFGAILDLIPRAEDVIKLTAICHSCGADAPFSRRLGLETQVEVIGGAEKYVAACRKCYLHPSPEKLR